MGVGVKVPLMAVIDNAPEIELPELKLLFTRKIT